MLYNELYLSQIKFVFFFIFFVLCCVLVGGLGWFGVSWVFFFFFFFFLHASIPRLIPRSPVVDRLKVYCKQSKTGDAEDVEQGYGYLQTIYLGQRDTFEALPA